MPDEFTKVNLDNAYKFKGYTVRSSITGTNKKDKITGTSESEILEGGIGKDLLKGGVGADGFLYQEGIQFGKKKADKILDFRSSDGDSILVQKKSSVLQTKST